VAAKQADTTAAGGLNRGRCLVCRYHTCGLTSSLSVLCWGRNKAVPWRRDVTDYPQDKMIGQTDVPSIGGGTGWKWLSAGGQHTCGVTGGLNAPFSQGGDIYCWGDNASGESSPPAQSWEVRWIIVSAGLSFSCGGNNQDQIICWGNNYFGQTRMPNFQKGNDEWWNISTGGWHWYVRTLGSGGALP
jgi:hypothetical protein